MKKLLKLWNNVLSPRAIAVLGPRLYARYLVTMAAQLPAIVRSGDLRPLDKAMGDHARTFRFRNSNIVFDCGYCDRTLGEDTFAFGIVREILIRNCYFKWHPASVHEGARTVVDLGANRGAFSSLMSPRATFILSVECAPQYAPVIRHNLQSNGCRDFAIETCFVGSGGTVSSTSPSRTLDELFRRHGIESCDLIKMDIEGSEFSLFDSPEWLQRTGAISMELHGHHGDPAVIVETLERYGFCHVVADENLQRLDDPAAAAFLYAWKPSLHGSAPAVGGRPG